MSDERVNILLTGIGGYGNLYVDALLNTDRTDVHLVGVIDPHPEGCRRFADIQAMDVPIYPSQAEFFKNGDADLVVISSPIFLHASQTVEALQNGCSVLCEKPMCASILEAEQIVEAEKVTGRFAGIGYQWSFNPAILALKNLVLTGKLGRPSRLRTLIRWPRTDTYYHRNNWAGRMITQQGNPVFDSITNNAAAHYLHNMFFVLGNEPHRSSFPTSVTAECYRANKIENYDTAALMITDDNGAELFFIASHAVKGVNDVVFSYEFALGTALYEPNEQTKGIVVKFNDGSLVDLGDPFADDTQKLWDCVDAIHQGSRPVCTAETAVPQVLTLVGSRLSSLEPTPFPDGLINQTSVKDDELLTHVTGLEGDLMRCYREFIMPSEAGYSWATAKDRIDTRPLANAYR